MSQVQLPEASVDLWLDAEPPAVPSPTVRALLERQAAALGARPFVTFAGETVSFAELDERCDRVANALLALGVGPGAKVGLLMRNSLEFLYSWFALAKIGAVMVPVNTAMTGSSLAYIVRHSDAVGLIADDDLVAPVLAAGLDDSLDWIVARERAGTRPPGSETFASLLAGAGGAPPAVALEAGTPLSIIYTSGTTGMPKGVVLPHFSYVNTGRYYGEHLQLGPEDRMHTCLPLFHCNAQQTTTMSALAGGRHLSLDERFSVSRFWSWLHENDATVTNLIGTMLTLLHKAPASELDRGHRLRLVVAGPIPIGLYSSFEKRFGITLLEGYGLTETGTMCVTNPVADIRPGTLGRPIAHTSVRVVDDDSRDVPPGTEGELVAQPTLKYAFMSGYYKDADATAAAVRDGWFHTGDLGLQRDDGYFVFVDRKKDMIRRRGENVSSFLLEKLLCDHPAVLEAAAIGVPSELGEEDVKVFVVIRPGASLSPEELVAWSDEQIPAFMQPRYVEVRAELPKTETGRVEKYLLRGTGVGAAWDREQAGAA